MFLLTRYRISMCQGLGPKKHDSISEIDRKGAPPAPGARLAARGRDTDNYHNATNSDISISMNEY